MQMQDMSYKLPDANGHFGPYGGIFVAETLMPALAQLREAYAEAQADPAFLAEFTSELKHYVGRPSPIYHAKRWSSLLGGAQIYLKREDLNHTGAHKINNCIGQAARDGWGRSALSLKPVLVNTALPRRPLRHATVWSALSTWGRKTYDVKLPTFIA